MSDTLTIRHLGATVKQGLRIQAAEHDRSMEAEARDILARGVRPVTGGATRLHQAFSPIAEELAPLLTDLRPRDAGRSIPFDDAASTAP